MGRVSFALSSFTAAVPAGILGTFCVMAFLNNSGELSAAPILGVLVATTLVISAFVFLIPFGILLFGGTKKKKVVAEKAKKGKAGSDAAAAVADDDDGDVLATSGEAMVMDADEDVSDDAVAVDDVDMEDTTAFELSPQDGADSDIQLDDSEEIADADLEDFGEIEEIEDEVILEEDDEDDAPRKKKRR